MSKYIFAFTLGIILVGVLESFGAVERCFLVLFTINVYIFLKNMISTKITKKAFMIFMCMAGFLIASYCSFYLEYDSDKETVKSTLQYKEDTAVLLVFEGEPRKYNLPILLKNIRNNRNKKPIISTPFELFKMKRIYEQTGSSEYGRISSDIYIKLVNKLDEGYDVFCSYVKNAPYYEDIIKKKILKNNYAKIIIVPVYLTQSSNYYDVLDHIHNNILKDKECKYKFIKPFYNSKNIINIIINSIDDRQEGLDKNKIGIILLGDTADNLNYGFTKHRSLDEQKKFMEKITKALSDFGYDDRKILHEYSSLNEEKLEKLLNQLTQYGIEKIFIVNTGDITDTITNHYMLTIASKKIKNASDIEMSFIKGWGADELLIEAMEFKIRASNVEKWQ